MATKKGGYILADFQKINLTKSSTFVPGIYKRLTGRMSKAIKITGIVINNVSYPDADISIGIETTGSKSVFFYAYEHFFIVSSENYVAAFSTTDPTATLTTPGTVKQAAEVPGAAGDTVTKAELNALITSLKNAGIMEG